MPLKPRSIRAEGAVSVLGAVSTPWPRPYVDQPAITSGKIFFTKKSGTKWVCSGTVVTSENRSLVWTAGHCVYPNSWPRRWMFCPGYDGEADVPCQYGKWPYRWLYTTPGWFYDGYYSSDFGVGLVEPRRSNPKRIANYVGSQGIAWNQAMNQTFAAFGYPADAPFDGRDLYLCEGPLVDSVLYQGGYAELAIDCDMTGGSSGGGWHIWLDGDGLGYVNGVNSFGYDGIDEMWSPYLGNEAKRLYNDTRY